MFKRLISMWLMVVLILISSSTVTASESINKQESKKLSAKPGTYYSYIDGLEGIEPLCPEEDIRIDATLFAESSNLDTIGLFEKNAVVLSDTGDKLTVKATVEESGFYNIAFTYAAIFANGSDIEYTLEIDNKVLFDGMKKLILPRTFGIAMGDFPQDNRGNELRPDQNEVQRIGEYVIEDAEGVTEKPYGFYLTPGEHELSFTLQREKVAIFEIRVFNEKEIPSYAIPGKLSEITTEPIIIEAEHAKYTTSSMLYPLSVMNDPNTTPSDPSKVRLNTIGGENWVYPSQTILWEFETKQSGYYCFGFRYLQNFNSGMDSHRRIKIDGEYPVREMKDVSFPYDSSWKSMTIGNEEPYYFYLEKGNHTIEMSVTTGDIAKLIATVDDAVYKLSEIYRKIITITGTSPDIYRDYYLDEMIPDLMDNMQLISTVVKSCETEFIERTGVKGGETATLTQICYQLDDFCVNPHTIPSRLSTFETNISSLATWVMDNREQPLEIDKIYVTGYGNKQPSDQYNIFECAWFSVKSFLLSFVTDYSSVGNVYDNGEVINVWISSGRDQAEIVKSMIDSDFSKNHGIPVNFAISSALMQAVMAGKGPDVAMNISRGQPVNLALYYILFLNHLL